MSVSEAVVPTWDPDMNWWSIGNYEIPGIEAYYWLAPEAYQGSRLESYASNFTFKVHWVVMRGDTSGKPTTGPSVILIGHNGMKIAYGDEQFGETNATVQIKLHEYGWYGYSKEKR